MSELNLSSTDQALPSPTAFQPSAIPERAVDYVRLVRFLVTPFLESPVLLKVDCETSPRTMRVLIRLAFEGDDKGRVFGRGGRNMQAVRTVVQAVAQAAGHSAHLEVFGSQTGHQATGYQANSSRPEQDDERPARPPAPRRPPQPRVEQ